MLCYYCYRVTTFGQLKPRLINILMSGLQVETDSQNTHMLLGALLLCVQDSVIHEELDGSSSDVQSSSAPETNLLSSGIRLLPFLIDYLLEFYLLESFNFSFYKPNFFLIFLFHKIFISSNYKFSSQILSSSALKHIKKIIQQLVQNVVHIPLLVKYQIQVMEAIQVQQH